ncbi:MAG: hypothetical protein E7390_09455 [Ruminococcaceae bacterium]|nr:hypothetical protein [Oscillospiraceae bacterium]
MVKKRMFAYALAVFMLSMGTCMHLGVQAATSLDAVNGSFEVLDESGAPVGWTPSEAVSWEEALKTDGSGAPGGGSNYVNLTAVGKYVFCDVAVESGAVYEFSFYYVHGKNARKLLSVSHLNETQEILETEEVELPKSETWSLFSKKVQAKSTVLRIQLQHQNSGSADSALCFDVFAIKKVTNLLEDGSFELQDDAWDEKKGTETYTTGAADGAYCLQLTGKASESYVTQKISGRTPYRWYKLSFQFKTAAEAVGAYPYIEIYSLDSGGDRTENNKSRTSESHWSAAGTESWQIYSYIFTFDEDAYHAGLTLSVRGAGEGKVVYYDDFELEEINFALMDAKKNGIETLKGGETVTMAWRSPDGYEGALMPYAALYELRDNKKVLIDVYMGTKDAEATGLAAITKTIAVPSLEAGKNYMLSTFLFDGTVKPLCESDSISN